MDLEQVLILAVMGAVVLLVLVWLAHRVYRETLRRRQVVVVRHRLVHRPTVAELRERCDADQLPRYPRRSTLQPRGFPGKHARGAA